MTAVYNRGRRVGRPLVFLLLWGLIALGTAACWPFPGLAPTTPTAAPAPATVARGEPTATALAGAPAAPTVPTPAGGVALPPPPTWPPPPTPGITATPPALRTPGPGAALALPPEPAPAEVAPALRPDAAGDLAGKDAWPRYQLALWLDPQAGQLWGHQRLRVTNTEDRPLDRIVLRLIPDFPPSCMDDQALQDEARLKIGAVQVAGLAVQPVYADGNTTLAVPLAQPLAPGAATDITLDFALALRDLSQQPDVWYFQSFYPLLAVYDQGAWHEEVTSFPDRVYAESSFYAVDFTAPTGTLVVSSGSEITAQDNGDGTTIHHFRAGPVREFSATACRACRTSEGDAGDVHVRTTYLPADEANAQAMQATAMKVITVYSETFGPYPFREFDLVVRPGLGGGIEYPGLIYVGPTDNGPLFRDFLVAHETGHQWWYSLVGDDIFRESWLDEAFANYSSVIFVERDQGAAAGAQLFDTIVARTWGPYRNRQLNADPHVDEPVGSALWQFPSFQEYNDIIYGKGAVFLHKLRLLMGDDAFFAGLRDHFARNKYGVATGRGFLQTMLAHVGAQAPAVAQLYAAWIEGR